MFNRENAVGIALLAACAVVAGIMIYYISIGERPAIDFGPTGNAIGFVLFLALIGVGIFRGPLGRRLRGGDGGQQWPHPGTGQKSLWDRLRGR
jgi:hypothetical protein